VVSFANDVEAYCKIVDDETLDHQIDAVFRDFKDRAVKETDLKGILETVTDATERLESVCGNTVLSKKLRKIFEAMYKEYDNDQKIAQLSVDVRRLNDRIDLFVRRGQFKERVEKLKAQIAGSDKPLEKLVLYMEMQELLEEGKDLC
jgi:hypothetical protein